MIVASKLAELALRAGRPTYFGPQKRRMNMPHRRLAGALILVLSGLTYAQESKIYSALTPKQLEDTLKGSKVEFKKLADKKSNTFFYDYRAKNFNLRLYYQDGKQLVVDSLFSGLPLEKINEWNLGGKFSRAGLGKDEKNDSYTVVETHLNLKGGVTEGAIQAFLNGFTEELDQFDGFLRVALPRKEAPKEEKSLKDVSDELVERILDDLKIKYTKVPLANGQITYHYESKGTKIRLTNWAKDLMLEAKLAKLPLDKVNQYNLDRKFVRAVAYSNKKGEYTTLEVNLSLAGGLTESILRNFISVFEEDVEAFAVYIRKATD
jgi:hypothetical protein